MPLSNQQLRVISIAERAGGVLSLLGCLLIVTTYCSSAAFRRPVRRLIFYATLGNAFSAVACLISNDGPKAGPDSALCQLQAFFIQYWMPADSLWSFCMALNIYLAFYRKYTAEDLMKLEKWYFSACYGLPLCLAVALQLIKTDDRGRVYGPAQFWCSIADAWQFLRLVCFYGPVWVVSILTLTIYTKVGFDIYHKHSYIKTSANSLSIEETRKKGGPPPAAYVSTPVDEPVRAQPEALTAARLESQQGSSGPNTSHARDKALRSYFRYSFLFFMAMVVTWIPSSCNRIYYLASSDNSFALNLVGALVLSLQGFWNTMIYVWTAFPALKELFVLKVLRKNGQHGGSTSDCVTQPELDFDRRFSAGSTSSLRDHRTSNSYLMARPDCFTKSARATALVHPQPARSWPTPNDGIHTGLDPPEN